MPDERPGPPRWSQLGLIVAVVWVGWCAWTHHSHMVDDAYISLRYAENAGNGEGLVFNPGERVEGITNLGWVLLLAGLHSFLPLGLPVLAKTAGLATVVAVLILATRIASWLSPGTPRVQVLVPLLVASSPDLVYFALAGMETGLLALLLLLALAAVAGPRPRPGWAGWWCGLMVIVRPETLVLFPVVLALSWSVSRLRGESRRGAMVAGVVPFVVVVAGLSLWRHEYYGAWLPNTYLAKSPGGLVDLGRRVVEALTGRAVNFPAPWTAALLGVVMVCALARIWHGRDAQPLPLTFLFSALLTGATFAVYAPGDWTDSGRYFGPYVPLAAILLGSLLETSAGWGYWRRHRQEGLGAWRAGSSLRRWRWALVLAVGLPLLLVGGWRWQRLLGSDALGQYPGFVLTSQTLVEPSRSIGQQFPPTTTIAARRIGALGYFGGTVVLDYAFGLTDVEVARLRSGSGGASFGTPTAPELAVWWRRRAPDCVLEDNWVLPPRPLLAPRSAPLELVIHGLQYREVRRFPLGAGAGEWVLACRPAMVADRS